ncbi:hypothetical protein [Methylomonas rosea]|uniref:DUF2892 domain-containing protein n=1 Tax=Methylomonas rosea TaxID=2952227 RepID=A0ABT1TPR8_9GAMM|nr:hypothetical protein [Methylomonas sp. WSC-7]MCQ8116603.1 hypothetical protein [Methylomonas sp. WSC-7]
MAQAKLANQAVAEKVKKSPTRKVKKARMAPPTNGEILVKGVVMGIVISGLTHASKSITRALIRHPLALFSGGVLAGYLAHKHRKDIIVLGSRTAEESRNFVLRQRENLGDLIAEIKEESGKTK